MTHYQLVESNKIRSFFVVFFFVLFITAASYVMARGFDYPLSFVGWAFVFSGLTSLASYFYSDKMILGISNARPASRKEFFDFYTVTENLCNSQRMPLPKLYVIEDSAMNAFATGRNPEHAVICATTGLLARLNRAELEGVIAHELGHVKNYDILLMSLVSILVGFLALITDWMLRYSAFGGRRRSNNNNDRSQIDAIITLLAILLAVLSPIIAQLIQLAISRRREFLADATSASITKNPEGLARALEKISADTEPLEAANKATAHLYISDPLKNTKGGIQAFAKLFQTHPPVEERIQALRALT